VEMFSKLPRWQQRLWRFQGYLLNTSIQ
jgi:hypothetical protein